MHSALSRDLISAGRRKQVLYRFLDLMAFREDLSDVQLVILAFLPIPTALLSLPASFTTIVLACRSRLSSYKRILIGLSISDILLNLATITGPLLVPHESSIILNRANETQATCNLSGVLIQMALLSNSFYTCFLSVYFLCTIRLSWSTGKFARVLEPAVHGFIVMFVATTAAVSLGMNVFQKSRVGFHCWITDDHLSLYLLVLVVIVLSCATVCAANLSIYLHVRSLMNKSMRRSMNPSVSTKRKNLVATQSFCYIAAYAVTYIPGFLMGLHDMTGGVLFRSTTAYFMFFSILAVLLPLTGFLNLLVVLRPWYLQFRERYPNSSKWHCLQLSLSNAFKELRRWSRKLHDTDRIQIPQHMSIEDNIDSTGESNEDDGATGTASANISDHNYPGV